MDTEREAAVELRHGQLCPAPQEKKTNWQENRVSLLSTITYETGL